MDLANTVVLDLLDGRHIGSIGKLIVIM